MLAFIILKECIASAGLALNNGLEAISAENRHAACLTGQLRGGSLSAVQLQGHLFNPSRNADFDVFYVGPIGKRPDLSLPALKNQYPTLRAWSFYNGTVSFGDTSSVADVLEAMLKLDLSYPNHLDLPVLRFKLSQLPRFERCGGETVECSGLVSFLMQAFQWRACAGLIELYESQLGLTFQSILRVRIDYYMPDIVNWGAPMQLVRANNLAFDVEDFLQYGGRDVMIPLMKTFEYLLSPPSSEIPDLWWFAKSAQGNNVEWRYFGTRCLVRTFYEYTEDTEVRAFPGHREATSKYYTIHCFDRSYNGVSTWHERLQGYVGPGDKLMARVAHDLGFIHDPDRCKHCGIEEQNGNGNPFKVASYRNSTPLYDHWAVHRHGNEWLAQQE